MESVTLFAIVGAAVIAMIAGLRHVASSRRQSRALIVTGLKAVDLFAPLPRGGDLLVTGSRGSGLVVLGLEIARRLLKHPTEKFQVVYFLDEDLSDLEVREQEMDEILPDLTSRLTVPAVTEEQLEQLLRSSGTMQTVLFAASENPRFLQIFSDAVRHVRENAFVSQRLTTVTVTECSLTSAFDARIECSQAIAKQGIYPAIDAGASHSSASNATDALRRQKTVAASVAKSVTALMPILYDGAAQDAAWVGNLDSEQFIALQALNFISQTFITGEPYTGKKGTFISSADAAKDFQIIMSGQKKAIAPSRFRYVDLLPQE